MLGVVKEGMNPKVLFIPIFLAFIVIVAWIVLMLKERWHDCEKNKSIARVLFVKDSIIISRTNELLHCNGEILKIQRDPIYEYLQKNGLSH